MSFKNLNSLGLKIREQKILILDQEVLPHKEIWLEVNSPTQMADCIRKLKVRGAPLIGVAAAISIADYARQKVSSEVLMKAAQMLREARPTAVNLMNAVDRMIPAIKKNDVNELIDLATEIFEEDVKLCAEMGSEGAVHINDGDNVLTHCNAGGLATVGIGTALGVIKTAFDQGKQIHVYVDETRPLLQGARLTTWELRNHGIPFTLICDNMAGYLMSQGKIQKIFVGADRIAKNGDFANKIGTYSVATMAKAHKIPFYVVAPYTTVDQSCPDGSKIPVELRNPNEVIGSQGLLTSAVYNPAFDISPANLATDFIGCRKYLNLPTSIRTET